MRRSEPPEAVLRLLGLAARGGGVAPGTERVREAARAGKLHGVIVAADASANTMDKLVPLLKARGIVFTVALSRAELGTAVGRSPLGAVGLTESGLAARVMDMLGGSAEAEE